MEVRRCTITLHNYWLWLYKLCVWDYKTVLKKKEKGFAKNSNLYNVPLPPSEVDDSSLISETLH